MENTLKIIFKMSDNKTLTFSLSNPRDNLTHEDIDTFAKKVVDEKAFVNSSGALPVALKEAYLLASGKMAIA